jgi:cytoskeletal protein CcmA (bactofilin family)
MSDKKYRRLLDRSNGPATLIGAGCRVHGELSGNGDFVICGEVEGNCKLDGTVTLAPGSRWIGVLQARNVVLAGVVEGDVIANGKLEIGQTARITGTVTGEAIAVAEGAVVDGSIRTTGSKQPDKFVEKRGKEAAPALTGTD